MSKLRVGLIFGGRSAEHEISIMSARSVLEVADKNKYELIPIAITKNGYWLSPEKSRQIINSNLSEAKSQEQKCIAESLNFFLSEKVDLVFPLLHGPYGEDGKIQGLLEMIDLPYVGAGVTGSVLAMDKVMMKEIFAFHQLPQGKFMSYDKHQFEQEELKQIKSEILEQIGYPCFIKPANMGSSIGISKVDTSNRLEEALINAFNYDHKVVIEENITGREVECSVLGNKEVEASLPGEIKSGNEFYDYEAKYKDKATELVIPAVLEDEKISRLQYLAIQAFKVLDCKGLARVDFFISEQENKVYLNEVNTIPGFTRYSMYPKLWEVSGLGYKKLIDKLISLALEK